MRRLVKQWFLCVVQPYADHISTRPEHVQHRFCSAIGLARVGAVKQRAESADLCHALATYAIRKPSVSIA